MSNKWGRVGDVFLHVCGHRVCLLYVGVCVCAYVCVCMHVCVRMGGVGGGVACVGMLFLFFS